MHLIVRILAKEREQKFHLGTGPANLESDLGCCEREKEMAIAVLCATHRAEIRSITRLIPKFFPADVACFCCSVKIFALPLVSNGTR